MLCSCKTLPHPTSQRVTAQHLNNNKIQGLHWLSKSPSLIPIEHKFDALDNKNSKSTYNFIARRVGELFEVWDLALDIVNESTLPNIRRCQGKPYKILKCEYIK